MRPRLAAVAVLAAVMSLTACTAADDRDGGDPPAGAGSDVESMFTKNVDRWAMPLDGFTMAPESPKKDAARWVLVRACMIGKGHTDYPQSGFDLSQTESQTRNSWYRILFDESIAKTWGYHEQPIGSPERLDAAAAAADKIVDNALDDFDACNAEAREQLGDVPAGVIDVPKLGIGAFEGAKQAPEVLEAVQRWKDCMAPQGIPDLPDDPFDMPVESLKARFGWSTTGGDTTGPATPGIEEIAVATADAACRTSSGFTQARYDAEWDRQIDQVSSNLAALERTSEAWDAYEAHLDELIAANGG